MGKTLPDDFRFHQLIVRREKLRNRTVLSMKRSDWETMKANKGKRFNIRQTDLYRLPFIQNSLIDNLVAGNVEENGVVYKIKLYRFDPKDGLDEQYNVDEYEVWEKLSSAYDRKEVINMSSTDDDLGLQRYEKDYIYLVKLPDEEIIDHHRPDLPSGIEILIDQEPN